MGILKNIRTTGGLFFRHKQRALAYLLRGSAVDEQKWQQRSQSDVKKYLSNISLKHREW